jgi:hypothetical protein
VLMIEVEAFGVLQRGLAGGKARAGRRMRRPLYRICIPEIAREMTRRWISEVPSKIV